MRNMDVANMFANGSIKGTGSHMFIEDNVIYSYGRHFPIAIRLKDCYLFNNDKYSSSTTQHKNKVLNAIGKDNIKEFMTTEQLEQIISKFNYKREKLSSCTYQDLKNFVFSVNL